MSVARIGLILFPLVLFSLLASPSLHPAQAQSQSVSNVWVDPVRSPVLGVGSSFSVVVMANLTSGESFLGFDVKLNYTTVTPDGRLDPIYNLENFSKVVRATSIDYSTSIFAGGVVGYECIDGTLISGSVCPADDAPVGQVRLFLSRANGISIVGPQTDLTLFKLNFDVTGTGTVVFALDYVGLKNPGTNPNAPSVHDIPVVKRDGFFTNNAEAAFFNFESASSPAILPGQPVNFDATGSYSVATITSYRWDFGDGNHDSTGPQPSHRFALPGRYYVQLNVTDSNGKNSTLVRPVVVVPALGELDLQVKNQEGNLMRGNVNVLLFNSSVSSSFFLNKTVNQVGSVAFLNLTPNTYLLKFQGRTIQNTSMTEDVTPGWTTQDTIYVFEIPPPMSPPDYSGIIFVGTILGGLGAVGVAVVVKRRNSQRNIRRQKRLASKASVRN